MAGAAGQSRGESVHHLIRAESQPDTVQIVRENRGQIAGKRANFHRGISRRSQTIMIAESRCDDPRHDLGEIRADAAYPLPIFQDRTGLSRWAIRQARAKGLRTAKVGRRRFVRGNDWIEFLDAQARAEAGQK